MKSVKRRKKNMDTTMLVRLAAGAMFVLVLGFLVQRRRTRVK
jgi:hypothetical protein